MDILGSLNQSQAGKSTQGPDFVKCSRKGCQAQACFELLWNNPKVHTADRLKSWVACEEHVQFLQDFLVARGFWKQTLPLG
ncbi:MAG: acetone carboxylase [Rothia sp. (in: high G+C Gram-positive bacteria)]|nr:acetone carboxylase [Rothia sp. (in: high G+C Gram-positive bacteria)]